MGLVFRKSEEALWAMGGLIFIVRGVPEGIELWTSTGVYGAGLELEEVDD